MIRKQMFVWNIVAFCKNDKKLNAILSILSKMKKGA